MSILVDACELPFQGFSDMATYYSSTGEHLGSDNSGMSGFWSTLSTVAGGATAVLSVIPGGQPFAGATGAIAVGSKVVENATSGGKLQKEPLVVTESGISSQGVSPTDQIHLADWTTWGIVGKDYMVDVSLAGRFDPAVLGPYTSAENKMRALVTAKINQMKPVWAQQLGLQNKQLKILVYGGRLYSISFIYPAGKINQIPIGFLTPEGTWEALDNEKAAAVFVKQRGALNVQMRERSDALRLATGLTGSQGVTFSAARPSGFVSPGSAGSSVATSAVTSGGFPWWGWLLLIGGGALLVGGGVLGKKQYKKRRAKRQG